MLDFFFPLVTWEEHEAKMKVTWRAKGDSLGVARGKEGRNEEAAGS